MIPDGRKRVSEVRRGAKWVRPHTAEEFAFSLLVAENAERKQRRKGARASTDAALCVHGYLAYGSDMSFGISPLELLIILAVLAIVLGIPVIVILISMSVFGGKGEERNRKE